LPCAPPDSKWRRNARLTTNGASEGAKLGASVVLDGRTLVSGASADGERNDSPGVAYVFEV